MDHGRPRYPICPRKCDAMPGPDTAHGTISAVLRCHAQALRCPVLRERMALQSRTSSRSWTRESASNQTWSASRSAKRCAPCLSAAKTLSSSETKREHKHPLRPRSHWTPQRMRTRETTIPHHALTLANCRTMARRNLR
eukprot:3936424-Rhodomonas_salina.1